MIEYEIRNEEVVEALLGQGFVVAAASSDGWMLISPENISGTRAKAMISTTIKLYLALRDRDRAQKRCDELEERLDTLNEKDDGNIVA